MLKYTALAEPRFRPPTRETPSCVAVTPAKLPSANRPSPSPTSGTDEVSESKSPVHESARPVKATGRQPIRPARRPAVGPSAPSSQRQKTRLVIAGGNENGGRSRRKSMNENAPTKPKKRPDPAS